MRWRNLGLAVALLVSTGLAATAALASSSDEAGFVSAMNSARASAGLPALTVDGTLVAYARSHTADMIAAGTIFHSSSSQLSSITTGWSRIGENVGMGPSVDIIHQAFMNSAGHRANILGDFNYVGVGADWSGDGTLYVTVIFMKKDAPPPAPTTTTAPPPTPTTQPAPLPAPSPQPSPAPAKAPAAPTPTTTVPEPEGPLYTAVAPALCDPAASSVICLD